MINDHNSNKDIQWLNTLRALAILGVIVIHVTSPIINMTYNKNMQHWWIGDMVLSAVRFAVPVFVMLSGATLLVKEYKLGDFYKKRISRVLFPATFWIIAYWIFRWFMLKPSVRPHGLNSVLEWAGKLFQSEGVSKHLWYIYMIMFLYLFLPFIGKFIRSISPKTILYILVAWAMLNTLEITKIISIDFLPLFVRKLYVYSLYSGYLVLGYYLTIAVHKSWPRWMSGVIIFTTVLSGVLVTYFLSMSSGKLNTTFLGTFSLNTIVQSVAIFLLIKNYTIKNKLILTLTKIISDYSFGIYLVHVMFLNSFFRIGIFWTMAHPIISLPLVTLITLVSSIIVIYLLRKMPFGNYISG